MSEPPLLEVRKLKVHFPVPAGVLRRGREWVRAVEDVSLTIGAGETLGLVGESGCGKTTVGRAITRLVEPAAGQIIFKGQDITRLKGERLRGHRRKLQIVFQDANGSLDPRLPVGESIGEALDIHGLAPTRQARHDRVESLLNAVGMGAAQAQRYPHEFSGGQRQRIAIARALAVQPEFVVCDEPVSALDVSVQAQVVNLLKELQQAQGLAYLFIAHDLAVVENISRRILVMYLGRMMEMGEARSVCRAPKHPYTQALISGVPRIQPRRANARIVLPGDPPSAVHPPTGCPFHPRCPIAEPRCRHEEPVWRELRAGHWVACHLAA